MKKAIYLVLATAVISGLANFLNKFSLSAVGKNAYRYTTLKNIFVALALSAIVLTPIIYPKLAKIGKKTWLKLLSIGLIGGGVPFLLFFKGLSLTSAVNASMIHKTLFLWVALLSWPFLKEKLSRIQFVALLILVVGNFAFGGFKNFSWGLAESLVLLATMLWSLETVVAKKILQDVDSIVLAWSRMFFGSLVLIGFLLITKNTAGVLELNFSQIGWLTLVGLCLTGYVVTWFAALKRLPTTVVTCFLVIASPITTLLNSIFVSHKLLAKDIWSVLIIVFGVLLFYCFKPVFSSNPSFEKANS